MFEHEPEGATPVDPDEAAELIPRHIHTRDELNVWEQENILKAIVWAEGTRGPLLDDQRLKEVHRRMFDETWNWAGRHARMWCDMLLQQHGREPIKWKNEDLSSDSEARSAYIHALRCADGGDYTPLFRLLLIGRE